MNELNNAELNLSTTAVDVGTEPMENNAVEPQQQEKMWNKAQIVVMMKKRVARSHQAFFNRYGVKDLKELDGLFEKSKSYDQMNTEFGGIQMRNSELLRENAFLKNNINPDKYNDIIAYFKGSGLDFNEGVLLQQLATHPEWLKPSNVPTTTIKSLGSEQHVNKVETNDERMRRVFGD